MTGQKKTPGILDGIPGVRSPGEGSDAERVARGGKPARDKYERGVYLPDASG